MAVQPGLCRTLSKNQKTDFSRDAALVILDGENKYFKEVGKCDSIDNLACKIMLEACSFGFVYLCLSHCEMH